MTPDAATLLQKHAQAVERYLRGRLPAVAAFADAPPRLIEAIEYSLFAGGKRLRPALVLECHLAVAHGSPLASPLPAAAAIELVHTFSLVHDDLPAMDDDDLRRGRATNHKVFGEAMAILAGDAMIALAFELLATEYGQQPVVARLVRELARAAGPVGMIGGQVLDMAAEGKAPPLEHLGNVHGRKTGALITAACRMGAIVAGANESHLAAFTGYGQSLGLAFQIADDLLDVTATEQTAGKATQKDAAAGKTTYPALLGEAGAREAARAQADIAIGSLAPLGAAGAGLRALAEFTVARTR